ncbi:hypothetical protein COOONC_01003 [Cooperia oncophora]
MLKKMQNPKAVIDLSVRGEYEGIVKEKLISIPYSDHSSRKEIAAFLSRLRFGELIPISDSMDSSTMVDLMKLSREMCHSSSSCPNADIQTVSNVRPARLGEEEVLTTPTPKLKFDFSAFRPVDMSGMCVDVNGTRIEFNALRALAPPEITFSCKPPPRITISDVLEIGFED